MKEYSRKILILFLFCVVGTSAFSQLGNPMQFLTDISQASRANPAFQNKTEKLVVGLPVISGTRINIESNFTANNFLNDQQKFDFTKLYSEIEEPGSLFTFAQVPLVFLSLKKNKNTYSFSISEKVVGLSDFDEELINFFAQGLEAYYGKNEHVGKLNLKTNYFRELEFGFATRLNKKLSLGIRPKVLFGKFHYEVDQIHLSVKTDHENEILWLEPQGSFIVGGPVKPYLDEETDQVLIDPDIQPSDYLFRFENMGAGIDLGFSYQIDKKTEFALSLLDLGFTSLKHSSYEIKLVESLDYALNNLYQSSDASAPNYQPAQHAAERLNDRLNYNTATDKIQKRKIESLPTQVNLQIKHTLQENVEIGAANHYTKYQSYTANNFSGFVSTKLGKRFSTVGTLNLFNFDKLMAGIGGAYTGSSAQFYCATNNIFELVRPTSANNLNLCFGVNFLFSTN